LQHCVKYLFSKISITGDNNTAELSIFSLLV
jgi:hypothetical protein